MSTDDGDDFDSKVAVLLIGVGSAAFVVTIYHCISMRWCNRYWNRANPPERDPTMEIMGPSTMEHSAAQLIPAYKYQKGVGLMGDDEEGCVCAICLSEFEEGEELKTLPECLHSYHVECIDMWLYSHSNCPMCRTGAISSPQIVLRSLELSSDGLQLDPDHNVGKSHSRALTGKKKRIKKVF